MEQLTQLLVMLGIPANLAGLIVLAFFAVRRITKWETTLQLHVDHLKEKVDLLETNIKHHLDNGLSTAIQNLRTDVSRIDARCEATHSKRKP